VELFKAIQQLHLI